MISLWRPQGLGAGEGVLPAPVPSFLQGCHSLCSVFLPCCCGGDVSCGRDAQLISGIWVRGRGCGV